MMIIQGRILRMVMRDVSVFGSEEGVTPSGGEKSGRTTELQVLASMGRR